MADSDSSSEEIIASKKLLCALLFTGILLQNAGRTSVSVVLLQLQESSGNSTNTNVSKPQVGYSQFHVGVILSSVYAGLLPSSFIGGFLAYRYSAMRVLLMSVCISSVVHCVGPFMFQRFETAVTQRVLAGLAEGPSDPAAYGVLSEYMLPKQSARVAPIVFAGFYFGQFVGIISTGFITQRLSWQMTFYLFGCLGIVWTTGSVGLEATGFAKKREKSETAKQDKGEITNMKSVPLCHILTSGAVWALILLRVLSYTWDPHLLPLYFNQSFETRVELAGVLAGIPILAYGALGPVFGLLGNLLCKYVTPTVARKAMAVTACLCVSGCLFVAAFTTNSAVAACFVAVSFGCTAARVAVADANPFDIAPRYASVISGILRVLCRIVGLTFPLLVATLTKNKTFEEWSNVVLMNACVFATIALIYGVFGSGKEQPWAAVPQGQNPGDGIKQGGSINSEKDDEIRPLVLK
ncbi:vesicular glutamate transporter 3-like [Branchiostoma floridae x Branchiostoma japonicum]